MTVLDNFIASAGDNTPYEEQMQQEAMAQYLAAQLPRALLAHAASIGDEGAEQMLAALPEEFYRGFAEHLNTHNRELLMHYNQRDLEQERHLFDAERGIELMTREAEAGAVAFWGSIGAHIQQLQESGVLEGILRALGVQEGGLLSTILGAAEGWVENANNFEMAQLNIDGTNGSQDIMDARRGERLFGAFNEYVQLNGASLDEVGDQSLILRAQGPQDTAGLYGEPTVTGGPAVDDTQPSALEPAN